MIILSLTIVVLVLSGAIALGFADQFVKERPDATPCAKCARPTWSATGLCLRCRQSPVQPPEIQPMPPISLSERKIVLNSQFDRYEIDPHGRLATDLPCSRCRYNLRGIPPSSGCPECDQPVVDSMMLGAGFRSSAMKDLLLDQSGHLASNQYCRRCGYNLRGLNFEAVCPECELSISKSLRGDSLNFADPAWVKRLHRGMIWIVTGAILSAMMVTIGPVFISFVVVGFGTGAGAGAGPPAGFNSMLTGFAILSLAVSAILFFGVWLVTTPDPATEQRESPLSARRLARWCSLAIAMASPLSLLQQQIAPPLSGGVLGIVFGMIGALVQIVSIVAVFAGFIYLASIARRMHARTLATQTNIAGWGYGITSGLVGVSTAMILMFMPAGGMGPGVMGGGGMNAGPGSQVGQLLFIGFCCGGPLVIIFAVWYIVVLICYLSPLSGAVAAAQAWQSEIGHAQPQRNSMPVDSAAADADTT